MTIFLCGFMGCGKSTIGEKLAQKLNCNFIDMDDYIEQKANMKIPQIFEQFGEPYFRDLETQAVKELSTQEGVISCGGGAMLREVNAQIANANGFVVLLDVPFRTCYYRIADSDRPIVRKNTRQQLEDLYNKRDIIYKKHASHIVDASHSPSAAVNEILNALSIDLKEN